MLGRTCSGFRANAARPSHDYQARLVLSSAVQLWLDTYVCGFCTGLQVLLQDCYFTSAQAGQIVAAFSYGEDKVEAAVKVSQVLLQFMSTAVHAKNLPASHGHMLTCHPQGPCPQAQMCACCS